MPYNKRTAKKKLSTMNQRKKGWQKLKEGKDNGNRF